jgi:uncharacterized membrane protein (UPF0127 family)
MILNQTTGKIISRNEIVCQTPWSRARGLMFRKKQNLIMIFPGERTISLHMFFVFYPITVLVVDAEKRVVEINSRFTPFTLWTAKKAGKYVLELAEMSGEVNPGDSISIS